MSLPEAGASGDTRCQNVDSSFEEISRKYLQKKKFLVNLSDLLSKFIFSKLKAFFPNSFPKRLISILSIYLHHSGECIRQIKRQI